MDAIKLLMEDHQRVRDLLGRILATTAEQVDPRLQLFSLLKQELEIHTQIEEDVFYPIMDRQGADEHEQVVDALDEHRAIRDLLTEMDDIDPSDPLWRAKAAELHDCIEHHVSDEENELFPLARDEIGAELEQLGSSMYSEKGDLLRAR